MVAELVYPTLFLLKPHCSQKTMLIHKKNMNWYQLVRKECGLEQEPMDGFLQMEMETFESGNPRQFTKRLLTYCGVLLIQNEDYATGLMTLKIFIRKNGSPRGEHNPVVERTTV